MGRGGGKVAGAKHSVAKTGGSSSSSTTVTVSGDVDPKVLGIGLAFFGFVFMILTIAVPWSMVANPAGTPCSNTDSLNRNEQAVCYPGEKADEDFLVEYDRFADGYVKIYRAKKSQLENNNMTRTYAWLKYQMRLSGSYDYFSFSVPVSVSGYLSISCGNDYVKHDKCDKVKMYFLTKEEFDNAVDENGEFNEKAYSKALKDFEEGWNGYFYAPAPGQYVFVFSLKKEKPTYVYYDVALRYNLFDTTGMEEVEEAECEKGKCEFKPGEKAECMKCKIKNVKEDEAVIADFVVPNDDYCKIDNDYPDLGVFCYDQCTNIRQYYCDGIVHGDQPEYFDIKIHDLDINWSGVAACAVIFALLTLLCFGLAALFLYKFLKKIGKLGKKIAKKVEKMEEEKNSTQMDAVPAQPAADPSYAAGQPYPGQPVDPSYAAAPYPGQPM